MPFFKSLALLYCSECFAAISSTFLLMPLWVMTCAISAKQTYDPLNKKVFNAYFSAIFCNNTLWFWRIKNWFATRQKIEIEYFEINSRFLGAKISFRWKCSYDIWKPFDFDKDIKFKNDSLTSFLGFSETHCWSLPILSFLLSWRSHQRHQQEAALSEVENGICCCHWLISASAALSMEGKQRA